MYNKKNILLWFFSKNDVVKNTSYAIQRQIFTVLSINIYQAPSHILWKWMGNAHFEALHKRSFVIFWWFHLFLFFPRLLLNLHHPDTFYTNTQTTKTSLLFFMVVHCDFSAPMLYKCFISLLTRHNFLCPYTQHSAAAAAVLCAVSMKFLHSDTHSAVSKIYRIYTSEREEKTFFFLLFCSFFFWSPPINVCGDIAWHENASLDSRSTSSPLSLHRQPQSAVCSSPLALLTHSFTGRTLL